jgi:hypothetical protein
VLWIRGRAAPDGAVTLPARSPGAFVRASAAADTVSISERLGPVDAAHLSPYAVEVMAASAASNANSWLVERAGDRGLPAATVSLVAVRNGPQRASQRHRVMIGAWHDMAAADSALSTMRERRVVARDGGVVIRTPYALLLADSASRERADAVMEVWRAKGVVPYALRQDDGTVRVYAGAFETVAQGVAMAAFVRGAGATPLMAYRTGRPD